MPAEVWRMLRRRKLLIATCMLASVLVAVVYCMVKSPAYEASARIEVSPLGTNSLGLDDQAARPTGSSESAIQLQTAVTILQSKTIALGVMQQLHMAERADFAGRWQQPAGASAPDLPPAARDKLLLRFRKSLKVEIVPKTDIITVQFRAKNPQLAADVVNSTVSSYTERKFRSSYDSATQVSTWLSKQMDDLKVKANQSQEKLAELQKEKGLIGGDETDNIVTEKLKGLDEQLTSVESDRIVKEARYRIAAEGNPELLASMVPEPTLQVLRSQQAELRVQYARLSTKFGEGYPKLAELGNQMKQVEVAIDKELKNLSGRYKNEYLASANAERMLRTRFEEQKQKAYELNQGAVQYTILKHEVEATQGLYQTLELKLRQAGIVAGLASANINVVEAGQVPAEPVEPQPGFDLLIGLAAGLGLGLVSAVALEAVDSTIRTREEAESVSGLPVLAVIPRIGSRRFDSKLRRLLPAAQADPVQLVAWQQPRSQAAESYRTLRTSLQLCAVGQPPKILTIASSLPEEGKTLTAINCATVLAQQGARVLLVDADLRQPCLHRTFGIPQDPGLSNVLAGKLSQDRLQAHVTTIPNLVVLPSGATPVYPAEMLASKPMLDLMEGWRAQFDYVVLDTPPISMFTDAVVLGARSDAVLLVARAGVTGRHALQHAREVLQRANVNLAGVVMNGVDRRHRNGYYGQDSYRAN